MKMSIPKINKGLSEEQEQTLLCSWIKSNYPNALYTVDLGGIRLQKHQRRIMSTRSKKGHPDLILQEWFKDLYCGLAIEFKKTGVKVSKKDGTLRSDKHLEEQYQYLMALSDRYYIAVFVCGLENAKKVISAYFEADENSISTINKYAFPQVKVKNNKII